MSMGIVWVCINICSTSLSFALVCTSVFFIIRWQRQSCFSPPELSAPRRMDTFPGFLLLNFLLSIISVEPLSPASLKPFYGGGSVCCLSVPSTPRGGWTEVGPNLAIGNLAASRPWGGGSASRARNFFPVNGSKNQKKNGPPKLAKIRP